MNRVDKYLEYSGNGGIARCYRQLDAQVHAFAYLQRYHSSLRHLFSLTRTLSTCHNLVPLWGILQLDQKVWESVVKIGARDLLRGVHAFRPMSSRRAASSSGEHT
jgi:hypothetical protein